MTALCAPMQQEHACTRVHVGTCACACVQTRTPCLHTSSHTQTSLSQTPMCRHAQCTYVAHIRVHTLHTHVHILPPPPPRAHRAQRPRDTAGWDKVHRAPCSALLLLLLSSCCWRCSAPAPKQVRDTGTLHCLVAARHAAAWHHVAPHGTTWHHTALHGTIWHHMAPHGTTWHLTEPHGTTWHHAAPYGTTWQHTAPHRTTWHHMAQHGITWHNMLTHGTTWHYMASHGTIC